MSKPARPSAEVIDYHRPLALPGIEVLDAKCSAREWRVIGTGYAVVIPGDWRGDVRYRGRQHHLQPGIALCNEPGDALVAKPAQGRAASFRVFILQPDVFEDWVMEHSNHAAKWCATTKPMSSRLLGRFARFFETLHDPASDLELESQALTLAEVIVGELVSGSGDRSVMGGPAIRGTARMREFLTEEGPTADLESLARAAGLSKFQALRAFKRRYGLPPHAYQLCLRVERARQMLVDGAAPADVAACCGFVDQSHLTRHFKRIVGVTPMRYAQASSASKTRSSGVYRISAPAAEPAADLLLGSDRRRR